MNKTRPAFSSALTGILITGLVLLSSSCSQNLPTGTDGNQRQPINILGFEATFASLQKRTEVSRFIRASQGGIVTLSRFDDTQTSGASVVVSLAIPPGALDQDTKISLTMDATTLDFEFGPSGLVFNTPVVLSVDAYGLMLSGVDAGDVQLLYDNIAENEWSRMENSGIILEHDKGRLRLLDGRIPHFSRYILADE